MPKTRKDQKMQVSKKKKKRCKVQNDLKIHTCYSQNVLLKQFKNKLLVELVEFCDVKRFLSACINHVAENKYFFQASIYG